MKKPFAGKTAGTDGNLGLPYLIVTGQAQIFRMEECFNSFFLVIIQKLVDNRDCSQANQCRLKKDLIINSCKENHKNPHYDVNQRTAEVFFQHNQYDRRRIEKRLYHSGELIQFIAVFREISCHEKHKQNLYEFGWLQSGYPKVYPCTGTELGYTQSRNIYRQKKNDRSDIEELFEPAEKPVVELLYKQEHGKAQQIGNRLYPNGSAGFAENNKTAIIHCAFQHG